MDLSILEVKTCPFCGGNATVFYEDWRVSIRCSCGASLSRRINGDHSDMRDILTALEAAKKAWNTEKERGISVQAESKESLVSLESLCRTI